MDAAPFGNPTQSKEVRNPLIIAGFLAFVRLHTGCFSVFRYGFSAFFSSAMTNGGLIFAFSQFIFGHRSINNGASKINCTARRAPS